MLVIEGAVGIDAAQIIMLQIGKEKFFKINHKEEV